MRELSYKNNSLYSKQRGSSQTKLLLFLHKKRSNSVDQTEGFSLLELIVGLGILSIITTFSLTGIGGNGGILSWATLAKIDEAKALLNNAAADCLQKNRVGGSDKDIIDEGIISDERINPIGFKINKPEKANKCSYFQLIPLSEDDNIRYPIGFSVTNGSLSKFATPTSSNKDSIKSCQRWPE